MDDDEIERLLTHGSHAELVVGHLQHFVGGCDPKIEAITLVSPPQAWPMTIRLEYSIGGQRPVEESGWGGLTDEPSDWSVISTRSEAEMWLGLTLAHLDEERHAERR